jgi:hypothetical protein
MVDDVDVEANDGLDVGFYESHSNTSVDCRDWS